MLRDMIGRAKSLLAKKPEKATDAVMHNRFEQRLFDELREEAPALDRTVTRLSQDLDYAEDLVRDTLLSFWQGTPEIRDAKAMRETHLANHAVAKDIERAEDLEKLRRHTKYDRYGASMAAVSVSEKIKEWSEEHAEELREQQERAEEAKQQAEDAAGGVGDALSGLEAFADPDYHGPPSPGQVEALEQALQAAEQAAQAEQEAAEQLEQQAAQTRQQLATPITEAIDEIEEELDEEQKLFRAWGVDPGELKEMDFEERARLAASLRSSRIGKYAELVGRFKLMEAAQQTRKVEYGRDEVIGVELTGELEDIIMSEYVFLSMGDDDLGEMFELDFYRRWQEQELLGHEFEGTERVGRGAIVACVDTSGSMTDTDRNGLPREAWAKAFALALLDQARRQRRDFVGINFSSSYQVSVHHFPAGGADLPKAMRFVQEFHNGGTSFSAPLDKAIEIIAKEYDERGKEKADIVFITDDECSVPHDWMRTYQERKRRIGFRTFGIAVGSQSYGRTLESLSDNVRAVSEFADPDVVSDIFRVL